jgi:hypothetical protein
LSLQHKRQVFSILVLTIFLLSSYLKPVLADRIESESSLFVDEFNADSVTMTITWGVILHSQETARPSILYIAPGDSAFRFIPPNDSAWRLVGTDNIASWRWEIAQQVTLAWSEKVPWNNRMASLILYPCDSLVLDIFVVSEFGSLRFETKVRNPYFDVEANVTERLPDWLLAMYPAFGKTPTQKYYDIRILVYHRIEVKLIALALLGFNFMLQPMLVCGLLKARKRMSNSNYLQVCLGFLLFLPFLLFSFRTSIAPSWLTNLDGAILSFMFVWASLLIHRLWHYRESSQEDQA